MAETRSTPPRRAPSDETTPRGDATREALIRAGIDLFGHRGYHATGNRALADAAGVNAALIGYHFGGKRGLYLAAFETIAGRMRQRLGPVADAIEAELEGSSGTGEEVLPLLHRLLDGFVAMLAAEESGPWARLIVREQMDPSDALDILYEGVLGRILALATLLVLRIRPISPGDPAGAAERSARLTALTVMGQALIFRVARATALRHMGWDGIGPEELAVIQRRVRDNSTAILHKESSV